MKLEHKNISENNFEQCTKCTICTLYCPMVEVNPLYPGPKQSGPDGERYRLKEPMYYDEGLNYCLNCKRCEISCPSGVRIGDIIALAKVRNRKGLPTVRDMLLSSTVSVGSVATRMSGLVNRSLESERFRRGLESMVGIDHRHTLPRYAEESFEEWFRREAAEKQSCYSRRVSYFHGCYANYNDPALGRELVEVLNAVGYGVRLLEGERCCGMVKIANGRKERAMRDAKRNLVAIRRAVAEGDKVVATSSSCTFALRDEYQYLLGLDNEDVKDSITLITRFLFRQWERGNIKFAFREDFRMRVAYHSACHIERLGWAIYSTSLLRLVPGLELEMLPSRCCGMAGTYGFKRENYDYSQAIGRPLFDLIEASGAEMVATDCESCKWNIERSTSKRVMHPLSILAAALDTERTRELNGVMDK